MKTPDHVLKIIEKNYENKEKTLDLSYQRLLEIPPEVFELTHLTALVLSHNQLTSVQLSGLINLTMLYLSSNQLTSIQLSGLTSLTSLDLRGNQLWSVKELSGLTNLTTLYLSNNQLWSIKELNGLTNLTSLYLDSNKLSGVKELSGLTNLTTLHLTSNKLSSVKELSSLTNLTTLYLNSNQLSSIDGLSSLINLTTLYLSNNQLISIKELSGLTNLRKLYLEKNPVQEPPIETLNMNKYGEVDIDAFFNYFEQLEEQGEDYLYEAKLLIVGKGGAGKTSLRTKVLDRSKNLPTLDESTHGIDIETWKFSLEYQKEFRVNIWDFGGQAIYHATHRYFLTNNALYVLVVDVRKDSEQTLLDLEIYWWLQAIELWGGNSTVLLLQNDTGGRSLDIDMSALRKEFECLDNQTYQVNLATVKDETHQSFNRILEAFKYQFKQLPNFAKALPKIWLEIRQFIEEQKEQNWMLLSEFMNICAEKKITEKQDAETLLSTFHELGICLWFQDHDLLRKIVILNPSWATNSAYAVLQNKTIKENFGRFNKQDLKQIWNEDCYTDMRAELLDLMKKFELCYELPEPDHFIAPQLLENKQPANYQFNEKDALHIYYKYDKFMPKGILHRLMIALHRNIAKERSCVWLTGVLFEKESAKAEILEKYADRKIEIRVIGNPNDKRDLMSIILYELDKINDSFNRNHPLQVDQLIPCQCDKFKNDPYFFERKKLINRANNEVHEIQCQKDNCYKMLDAQKLLDGISAVKKVSLKQPRTKSNTSAKVENNFYFTQGENPVTTKKEFSMTNSSISNSLVNLGEISGEANNSIQQLPVAQKQPLNRIKELLENNLPDEDKAEALKMLKQLAETSKKLPEERKGLIAEALGFLKGSVHAIKDGKEEYKQLLEEIRTIW